MLTIIRRLKMTVKDNSEKIEKIQSRINKLVDELFLVNSNLASFKSAVAEDLTKLIKEVKARK